MTDLGDYHVKPPAIESGGEPPQGLTIALAILVLAAVGGGLYWFMNRGAEEPPPAEAPLDSPLGSPLGAETAPELLPPDEDTPAAIVLPPLGDSDAFVRTLVGALSSHPGWAGWLIPGDLIGRFVMVVDNVANGSNPSQHLGFLQPETAFRVVRAGSTLHVDPASYNRYDLLATVVDSLDVTGAAEAFATLEPLLDEAYVQLGYPQAPFVRGLEQAASRLLEVPDLRDPPALVEHVPFFSFADPALDALSPAQKQFLGMGPRNVRIVQAKIRQIATAIGIPDRQFP